MSQYDDDAERLGDLCEDCGLANFECVCSELDFGDEWCPFCQEPMVTCECTIEEEA